MVNNKPLALEPGSSCERVLLDALPYIDKEIDEDKDKLDRAMQEVDAELKGFAPDKDYIEHLPDIHQRKFLTPCMKLMHERLETGQPRSPADDLDHSNASESSSPSKSIDEYRIKLEYQKMQLDRLEVFAKQEKHIWDRFVEHQRDIQQQMDQELSLLNKKVQEVNYKRKTKQEEIKRSLEILHRELCASMDNNSMLTRALQELNGNSNSIA